MIDWVNVACISWGAATRWIHYGADDGWPTRDTIEKARSGLLSAGTLGLAKQSFPEVRVGYALDVQRAMVGEPDAGKPPMPFDLQATLWLQYVPRSRDLRRKVDTLSEFLRVEVRRDAYFRNVDRAHYFLCARIAAPPEPRAIA